jgi:hypothetical protein
MSEYSGGFYIAFCFVFRLIPNRESVCALEKRGWMLVVANK